MNSVSDQLLKPYGRLNSGKLSGKSDVFEPSVSYNDYAEVKQRAVLVEWINGTLLNLNLPAKASSEELRARLSDGTVLLQILKRLRPVSVNEVGSSQSENVGKFLAGMDDLGIPRFELSDLQKGSMKPVVDCLLAVRARFIQAGDTSSASNTITRNGSPNADASSHGYISPSSVEEKHNILPESKLKQSLLSHEPAAALMHHSGHKFHEVFQLKQGRYADLSAARISEMMKSNSLDNAPTQSLLSVVNGILDEGIERKNGEIPHRVACLLRKVVLEIERRISTQAEHLRTQNNLFKTREDKYQSRIHVLEALAAGSVEETRIATNQLQQAQNGKSKLEEKKNSEDVMKLLKEKEQKDLELSALRRELEIGKRTEEDLIKLMKEKTEREFELSALRRELEIARRRDEDLMILMKEKAQREIELSVLRQELERARRSDEDVIKLMREKERKELELSTLRQELEIAKRPDENVMRLMKEKEKNELDLLVLRQELEVAKAKREDAAKMMKEKEQSDLELSALKKELEIEKRMHELHCLQMETEAKGTKVGLEGRLIELEHLLEDSTNKIKTLEVQSEATNKSWNMKELEREIELSALRQELESARGSDEDVIKLTKEKEKKDLELSTLKEELEIAKRANENVMSLMKEKEKNELDLLMLRQELEVAKGIHEDVAKMMKEKEQSDLELSALKKELEIKKQTHELHCLQMETEAKGTQVGLERRMIELEHLLEDSTNKIKALEAQSESTNKSWNRKENILQNFVNFHVNALGELRSSSKSIKHEILKAQKSHSEDVHHLGIKLKALVDATKNYHLVLAENRKLFNELQDLKGNIRVYCRIRPFLPGQSGKNTIVEYIGETGELVVANPAKQSKDGRRMFRFNKVYGPEASQAEVFSDTQPLVRSVLDGYNVCIFAYGQTGSGKTYTMTGPNNASAEDWGVNYRALNDLFSISQNRSGSFTYDVGVQMIEIYNEQVRDLLSNESSQKRLGIVSISQSLGLAVPDARMHAVTSTSDVIDLMDLGLKNRAVGATTLNERSSRSHSVVSIHVRGKDLHNGASLQGNLHLVDLAGSERVDRSEVTGDRLKEAQHINKSLSALGDVVFALAQKSPHIPYRNSKLTQLLQSSLGGRAKTLMFVQLNHDIDSYSESMSTLKFAERVSGVELGAARSSKEGRDVRELMEQVASLKDTISKKDDEIDRLQLLKDLKGTGSTRSGYESSDSAQRSQKTSGGRGSVVSEAGSLPSMDDFKHPNNVEQDNTGDSEILDYGDGDSEERLSEMSDGDLSVGAEQDIMTEEGAKLSEKLRKHSKVASKIRSLQRAAGQTTSTKVSVSRDSLRASTSVKKTNAGNSTMLKPARWS